MLVASELRASLYNHHAAAGAAAAAAAKVFLLDRGGGHLQSARSAVGLSEGVPDDAARAEDYSCHVTWNLQGTFA